MLARVLSDGSGSEAKAESEHKTKLKLKRSELFITSKCWQTNHAPEHVRASCLQSLKDLRVDYLDLYLVHVSIVYLLLSLCSPLSGCPCDPRQHQTVAHTDSSRVQWPLAWRHTGLDYSQGGAVPNVREKDSAGVERVRVETAAVPLQETWRAFEKLVDDGLVRAIGVSNCEQLTAAILSICLHTMLCSSSSVISGSTDLRTHPASSQSR